MKPDLHNYREPENSNREMDCLSFETSKFIYDSKLPLQEHPFPQRQFSFPRPAPEVDPGIFNQRRSFEQPFQGRSFFVCEPFVFQLERLAEDFQKVLHPIAGGLHGLSDFLYQFIGGRGMPSGSTFIP